MLSERLIRPAGSDLTGPSRAAVWAAPTLVAETRYSPVAPGGEVAPASGSRQRPGRVWALPLLRREASAARARQSAARSSVVLAGAHRPALRSALGLLAGVLASCASCSPFFLAFCFFVLVGHLVAGADEGLALRVALRPAATWSGPWQASVLSQGSGG